MNKWRNRSRRDENGERIYTVEEKGKHVSGRFYAGHVRCLLFGTGSRLGESHSVRQPSGGGSSEESEWVSWAWRGVNILSQEELWPHTWGRWQWAPAGLPLLTLGVRTGLHPPRAGSLWTPNDEEEEAYGRNCCISHNPVWACWMCCFYLNAL